LFKEVLGILHGGWINLTMHHFGAVVDVMCEFGILHWIDYMPGDSPIFSDVNNRIHRMVNECGAYIPPRELCWIPQYCVDFETHFRDTWHEAYAHILTEPLFLSEPSDWYFLPWSLQAFLLKHMGSCEEFFWISRGLLLGEFPTIDSPSLEVPDAGPDYKNLEAAQHHMRNLEVFCESITDRRQEDETGELYKWLERKPGTLIEHDEYWALDAAIYREDSADCRIKLAMLRYWGYVPGDDEDDGNIEECDKLLKPLRSRGLNYPTITAVYYLEEVAMNNSPKIELFLLRHTYGPYCNSCPEKWFGTSFKLNAKRAAALTGVPIYVREYNRYLVKNKCKPSAKDAVFFKMLGSLEIEPESFMEVFKMRMFDDSLH
jgi:hypothetical protein